MDIKSLSQAQRIYSLSICFLKQIFHIKLAVIQFPWGEHVGIGSEVVHVTSPLNQFIMSTIMNANNSTIMVIWLSFPP